MKKLLILAPLALLAGCGAGTATETRVQTQYIPVRAACPAPAEYAKLKAGRPVPLIQTPEPATAQERSDKQFAQLGRYEAPGGWADKVSAALDRCQQSDPIPVTPGVASPP